MKTLFVGFILYGFMVPAWAINIQHDYTVMWDQNDPSEGVNRYVIQANSSTENLYSETVVGNPPVTKVVIPIIESVGTEIEFTAIACRDLTVGDPDTEDECSDPSDPIRINHSPASITKPVNVRVEVLK